MRLLRKSWQTLSGLVPAALTLAFGIISSHADSLPSFGNGSDLGSSNLLCQWSFNDTNFWTSDLGYAPVSFTNLAASLIGNGTALFLNTNEPAWLQYNVYEADGTTNLTVDQGSIAFWFAPSSWSSINAGGTGLGEWGHLIEVGAYTEDSSYGLWGLSIDPAGANLYFVAQTNDLSSNVTTYLSAPIAWTTNQWHFITLTYSATNSSLYLDGALATNGLPLTVWPGSDVLANGFCLGSSSNGLSQAHGMFDDVQTFNIPLDAGTIQDIYNAYYIVYRLNPMNQANEAPDSLCSAQFIPSSMVLASFITPDVITGPGNLQLLGSSGNCVTTPSAWITNMAYTLAGSNSVTFTFSIAGGTSGVPYDVFATTALNATNGQWAWMGQGYSCNTYALTNLPSSAVFLILGTPQDSDGDGLTDAYEKLVSHTDPQNYDSVGSGMPEGWQVLLGMDPHVNQNAQPGTRANYNYDFSDWLNGVSGIKSGAITPDNEGNVLSVSQ